MPSTMQYLQGLFKQPCRLDAGSKVELRGLQGHKQSLNGARGVISSFNVMQGGRWLVTLPAAEGEA